MRIALAQMDIAWEDPKINLRKFENFVERSVELEADFVVFPEMTLSGFTRDPRKAVLEKDAEKIVQDASMDVVVGLGVVEELNGKYFNEFVVYDSRERICTYRKIHLFSLGGENDAYTPGSETVSCKVLNARVTPFVCYDLRFPCIFQEMALKTDIFVIPANWPKKRRDHWISLLKARAVETQSFVVGVNRVGEDPFFTYSGDSMVIDPWGNVLASTSSVENILVVDVDLEKVRKVREGFPVLNDRIPHLDIRAIK